MWLLSIRFEAKFCPLADLWLIRERAHGKKLVAREAILRNDVKAVAAAQPKDECSAFAEEKAQTHRRRVWRGPVLTSGDLFYR